MPKDYLEASAVALNTIDEMVFTVTTVRKSDVAFTATINYVTTATADSTHDIDALEAAKLAIEKHLSVVVLPRISFTTDGKTDTTTCCLLIINAQNRFIKVLSREDLK